MSMASQPTRIAIAGSGGRMGRMLLEALAQDTNAALAAALEVTGSVPKARCSISRCAAASR